LRNFVESGGGVFIAIGELAHPSGWQAEDARALAPRFGNDVVDRNAEFGGVLASYDRDHPVFEIFSTPRSGDFTAASFYRYWRLEPAMGDLVLASFDDGTPALVARPARLGRVLIWPTTLDRFWNDLVLHGQVFVPFIQQATRYVAGYEAPESWHTVGNNIRLVALDELRFPEGTTVELMTPRGNRMDLIATGMAPGAASTNETSDRIPVGDPGFYTLKWSDGDSDHTLTVAANLDRMESDLSKLDPEELTAALTYGAIGSGDRSLANQVAPESREARQAWWWYLLVLVFVLLATDTALSNYLSPRSASSST